MTTGEPARHARRVAIVYAVAASLWILGSDWLLAALVPDEGWRMQVSALKGWAFVAVTALLLYVVLRRRAGAVPRFAIDLEPLRPARLLAAGGVIAALAGLAIWHEVSSHQRQQAADLESIAGLRAQTVGNWIKVQRERAEFLRSSSLLADLARRGLQEGDEGARTRLLNRLGEMRAPFEQAAIALFDAEGERVGGDGIGGGSELADVTDAVRRAVADGRVHTVGLRSDVQRADQVWYDLVVPIAGAAGPARAAVVMRIDASTRLLKALQAWPVPSRSATTMLVRREGPLLYGPYAKKPVQLTTPDLVVGRAILGEIPFGPAARGRDSRGVDVLASVMPVPDSDWFVVTRIDQAEIDALVLSHSAWIAAAALLLMAGLFAAGVLRRERRALAAAQDTHRLQAERLRALGLLQAIADSSSDAIFAKDLEGRYLMCNREAARVLGRAVEQVVGVDDRALLPPEQAAQLMDNDARVMAADAISTYEERITQGDTTIVFLATKGPLHDEQGRVIGMFGISRDITERERQRAALADSETTQRVLLEAMADGMFVAQDYRFVFANPALPRMLGRPLEGFVDVPFAEVVAPESLALWTARFEARVGDGPEPEGHYEVQFLRADGSRLWVDLRATRLELHGRRAVLGLVTDVTEQRRAAQALGDAAELLQAVEDSVLDHMAVLDRDGRVTAVNEAWRRFGRENGRAVERDADLGLDYLALCDRTTEVAQGLRDVIDGRSAHFRHEYPCNTPGGERWFQLNATPLRTKAGGAVVVHTDITALRHANAELDHHRHRLQELVDASTLRLQETNAELLASRDRAEEANRAKSAFLANMSHEIRTPMNAIVGLTHLLRRDARDPLQAERLGQVAEAAAHLLQVLNDILDLSKIEAGKLDLEHTDFSLAEVLTNARALVAERALAKGLALTVGAPGVPDALHGDPTRLTQALLNLLSNAVKFTERGQVDVQVDVLAEDARSVLLRFAVRDTGIGVAPETLGTLFSAFTQADTSTTRRFGGTGLGLAITQRLAQQMEGAAGADSRPGQGSTFWFTARLAHAHAASPPAAGGRGHPAHRSALPMAAAEVVLRRAAGGRRVLLVEDNPVNQDVALELLRSAGLEVELASDGAQALAAVQRRLPDLVLMDVQMPVMDGLEATRRLRTLPLPRHLPVVAMTANAFGEDRHACLAAGMDDHLSKPVDPEALYQVLLRWLPATPVAAAGPAAPATELPLPPVAGLDVERALRLAGGRPAVLRRVLRQFADHYRGGLDLAANTADTAGRATVARAAHSVKGASSAIGAVRLPVLADALERALEAGDGHAGAAAALATELRQVVTAIDGVLAAPPAPPADPAAAPAAADLRQLAALVEAGDFDATTLFRTLRPSLAAWAPAQCERLDHALAGFDFEAAAEALRALPATETAG